MQPFGAITHFAYAGIDGLILYFEHPSLSRANEHVHAYTLALRNQGYSWIREILPAYDSLLIVFELEQVDFHHVYHVLRQLDVHSQTREDVQQIKHHRLPVWYAASTANDFAHIYEQTGLNDDEIIRCHSEQQYRVYAVGFAPGFAYLGDIPEKLACPRLKTPRKRVPKGAVAIADRQTAVYPQASPGGWNLLGLCPSPLFNAHAMPTGTLNVGDAVTFYPVCEDRYRELMNVQ